jgi:hypothetical protein
LLCKKPAYSFRAEKRRRRQENKKARDQANIDDIVVKIALIKIFLFVFC